MLNSPRSSFVTSRLIRKSRFSARSSGVIVRTPMGAWKVRLSFERRRTVDRMFRMIEVGSAPGGTGRGILPRGPSTAPSPRGPGVRRGAARAAPARALLREPGAPEPAALDGLPPPLREDDVVLD